MKNLQSLLLIIVFAFANLIFSNGVFGQTLDYELEPIPDVHDPLPENSVVKGDSKSFDVTGN